MINPFSSIQSSVMVEGSLDNGIEGMVLVFDQAIEASGFFDRPVRSIRCLYHLPRN